MWRNFSRWWKRMQPAVILDKSQFVHNFQLTAVQVPAQQTSIFMTPLKRSKPIIPLATDQTQRLILLDQTITGLKEISQKFSSQISGLADLSEEQRRILNVPEVSITQSTIQIGYDDMTTDEILRQIVPKEVELVTSFEAVGHIAHMNLRDDCLPYKHVIGQVILDKNKQILSVVNKTGEIDTVFRTFKMELLAGIEKMETEVHESNCRFQFNFAEVYWNSRLGTEHERLVKMFKPGEVVVDMFCGVGPFAVPAAKRGCIVFANDLNPRSHYYLEKNVTLNKCSSTNIKCFNMDGRDFVRELVCGKESGKPQVIHHVVMNLPASAVSFLDVFDGLFPIDYNTDDLPIVHCYGFSTVADVHLDIVKQAQGFLRHEIQNPQTTVVRNVSPHKFMMRLSFKLPASCCNKPRAVRDPTEDDVPMDGEPQQKKQKR